MSEFTSSWIGYEGRQQWIDFLQRFPEEMRDVYSLPDYVHLYETETDRAACFTYEEGSQAFLHCFLLCEIPGGSGYLDISTAYGYGGPIANSSDCNFVARAYAHFRQAAVSRRVVAELIRFHPLLNNQKLMSEVVIRLVDVCPTIHVDIDRDEEQRWSQIYSHANRKNINKARRQGVQIIFGQEPALWDAYHELYTETMEANHATGFYYFSPVYYERLRETLQDHYTLAAAHLEGRIVSVLLLLFGRTFAHCHRIGTKRDLMPLGVNNLLHHEVIRWCRAQGMAKLLIGGGRGNTDEDPLFRFKRQFSDVSGRFFVGESILDADSYSRLCEQWAAANPGQDETARLLKWRS
jgi:Acetyltransferase (GNAT) domain